MTLNARYLLSVGLLANSLAAYALPPVVTLSRPVQLATFSAPASIPLQLNAFDPDGGAISSYQFFLNGAPFTPPLTNVGTGTFTISAQATDSQGETGTSNAVTFTVYSPVTGNTAPAVELGRPSNGSAYSLNSGPVTIPVLVNATDNGLINRIEFFAIYNGSTYYLGLVQNGVETSIGLSGAGAYQFYALAYDNFGVASVSNVATINAYAASSGNTPPTSTLTSPLPGTLLPGNISIAATANDPGGSINRVEFYVNEMFKGVDFASPYAGTLVGVGAGNYTLKARAYDNLGVYTDSSSIPIVVNTTPSVSITSPANNVVISAPATFTLQSNALDADGNLSKVEFYQGTTLLGEDATSPYSWSLNNVTWGTYAYTAKAYDALGAVVTSSAVNVVVNQTPTIGLTASNTYGGYNAPADILLTAMPGDVDGTISKVEFYSGTQLVNTKTASPYEFTVVGAPAGNYTYTAKAYDNRSAVTTSNAVNVTVSPSLSPATFNYDELGRLVGVQH